MRVHNFSAGPAAMPLEVLQEAQQELLDYHGSGMSVLEMSHRSPAYQEIIDAAEKSLRKLYNIPSNYKVLFLQGGATLQFSGVPLNLMKTKHAGYIVSGNWSKRAWQEASRYGTADLLATSEADAFSHVPALPQEVDQSLDYVYYCMNETVYGTMFHELPQTGNVPLVVDVSSCFLSMPLDISQFGMVLAGAQKNGGPAGVCVVIVREDLIQDGPALSDIIPTYMSYKLQADKGSMYNTPNTYGIYLCGKVFDWVQKTGGLTAMEARNWEKVNKLYCYLEQSSVFIPVAAPASRSIANVVFRTASPELDATFVAGAAEHHIVNVKGHRVLGGMRASCYNAVDMASIDALLAYMQEFESAHATTARSL